MRDFIKDDQGDDADILKSIKKLAQIADLRHYLGKH
jgi:hypothetical protein